MPGPSASSQAVVFADYVTEGLPKPETFKLSEVQVPSELEDGQALLELLYISVDPYMRGRMINKKSYVPPFQPGKPLNGYGLGRVKESKAKGVKQGDLLSGNVQWQQLQVVQAGSLQVCDPTILHDLKLPASTYLGTLGMTGMTAYMGMTHIGKPKEGETVLISGAAGAVGNVLGQLCKHVYKCKVVGSAGSDDKVSQLKEFGYDHAWNYKTKDTKEALAEYCPDGVDVYWDNVGGPTLEAALDAANNHARVVCCGSISNYNTPAEKQYGVKNLFNVVGKRILMQGFIVGDFQEQAPQFLSDMSQYLRAGQVQHVEHLVTGGLAAAGPAFIDMMGGANIGKTVVQVSEDPYRAH